MDLSQQELPLTAYFTRGSKESGSRAVSYKKDRSSQDSQSVARSSKRRRSNVQGATASPFGSSTGQSKSRPTTLQLPTPATSTRKRTRNGRLELPTKTQPTSTGALSSSVGQNASVEVLAQLQSSQTPSKMSQSSHEGAEDAILGLPNIPLATPSTGRGRTTKSIGVEFYPGPRRFSYAEAGVATPRRSPRKITEPLHGVDDYSPLAHSDSHLSSEPSRAFARLPDSEVSHAVLPHVQHSARSTAGRPSFPFDSDCPDPFRARKKIGVVEQQNGPCTPSKQYSIQSKTLDGQSSNGHFIPTIPVPSSQSQYLLHLDATPKRKRCSQHTERVISSQTQEERELTLSTPHKLAAIVSLSAGVPPGKCMRVNAQTPRLGRTVRKSQHVYTLGSTPAGSPINSPAGPSRSFFATEKALLELSSKFLSPSRREGLTAYHSPGCKSMTPHGSPCQNSIENISPAHIEDSLTESESESDILRMKMKANLDTTFDLHSREANQVPRHSLVAQNARPPSPCGFTEWNLPGMENDSATEAESDTEILHCVAAIGKKRPRDHCSEVSRKDTPPPPVISPLVSPARSRIAAIPPIMGSTQFILQEGDGLNVSGSCASHPPTMEQPQISSESLPSVVRDFIRMFPGEESYPADFPESLRV